MSVITMEGLHCAPLFQALQKPSERFRCDNPRKKPVPRARCARSLHPQQLIFFRVQFLASCLPVSPRSIACILRLQTYAVLSVEQGRQPTTRRSSIQIRPHVVLIDVNLRQSHHARANKKHDPEVSFLKIPSALRFQCVRIAGSQNGSKKAFLILQCFPDVAVGPFAQVKRVSIYGGSNVT